MPLVLRPWSARDALVLMESASAVPDLQSQFGGATLENLAGAEAFIATALANDESGRNWAIVEDGVVVGNIGATAIERRHGTAWMSYWLLPRARGKGYAVRALSAVSTWAFEDGLHRLELGHRINNPASCRVACAAGYAPEGIEREKLRYGNERFDVETHGRLSTDPEPDAGGERILLSL